MTLSKHIFSPIVVADGTLSFCPQRLPAHIWVLRLAPEIIADIQCRAAHIVAPSEMEAYHRFAHADAQQKYLAARVMIRTLLSHYFPHVLPSAWSFEKNNYGKPQLKAEQLSCACYFNISHAGPYVVVGLSPYVPLGIDVESLCPSLTHSPKKLAQRFFSAPEALMIAKSPQEHQTTWFARLWNAKEALGKAQGSGLNFSLKLNVLNNKEQLACDIDVGCDRFYCWQRELDTAFVLATVWLQPNPYAFMLTDECIHYDFCSRVFSVINP